MELLAHDNPYPKGPKYEKNEMIPRDPKKIIAFL
jgi:hypothetical protein